MICYKKSGKGRSFPNGLNDIENLKLEVFSKKNSLKQFLKFLREHLKLSAFLSKVSLLGMATLLKLQLHCKFFPKNFEKSFPAGTVENVRGRFFNESYFPIQRVNHTFSLDGKIRKNTVSYEKRCWLGTLIKKISGTDLFL